MKQTALNFQPVVRPPVWVCYGLGTDSTAMLVGMVERGEPVDLITFADTGAELPRTYAYLPIMDAWLKERGYPGIVTVRYSTKDGRNETLEESVLKNQTVPSLAFGGHTCSIRFKIDPQVKYAKKFQPFRLSWSYGGKVIRCIGYDDGDRDRKRSCRSTTQFPDMEEFQNRYPLQEWGWDRDSCREKILSVGLPDPGKSSCYFCPARKKPEIVAMREEYPEFFAKAIELERRALEGGKLKNVKGLGRSFAWASIL